MMRKVAFAILCSFCLSSCIKTSHYLKISDFKIEKNALKNFELVTILYVGPGKEFTENRDYYNQLVVVSEITGDTINVLYADDSDFNKDDIHSYFVDPEHIANAINQSALTLTKDSATFHLINKTMNDTAIRSYSIGDYNKVMIDPKFMEITKNHYPTTFGKVVRDTTRIVSI